MTFWEIILLGIIQGLTEFLPVSSSGHLVVTNALLEAWGSEPVHDLVEVEIVLHLGTLLAVLVYYRREIVRLFTLDRRVIPLLVIGTIPAAMVGVFLKKGLPEETTEVVLANPLVAGVCFPVTAAMLLWTTRHREGTANYVRLGWLDSIKIGVFQAIALLPGISRSGATITAGLGVGLQRESSATYAFLLAIPAIAGGGLLEMIDAIQEGTTGTPISVLAAGFAISFVVGLVALALLIRWVRQGRLSLFAYYLIPLGLLVILWRVLG